MAMAMAMESLGKTMLLLLLMLVASAHCSSARTEHMVTFLSPGMTVRPGDVTDKYFDIAAPVEGKFATVNFHGELVEASGEPVLQSDVYLHHFAMLEYGIPNGAAKLDAEEILEQVTTSPPHAYHRQAWDGVGRELKQAWAMGGESRHRNFEMPAPYGLECGGNSQWVLNVHGLDMRGALNMLHCYECRCDVYNGGVHKNLPEGYLGGTRCCPDGARCPVASNATAKELTVYLKYTWTYVPFDKSVVPVEHVVLDVLGDNSPDSVEYTVEGHCKHEDIHKPECIDVRESVREAEHGGDVVYVVSHLHKYSLGSTVWGEDGRLICDSSPIYGHELNTAGNEEGFVVGIHHCNPSLNGSGAGKIRKGEKIRYQVRYSKVDGPHTGVMGVGFMKVAEPRIASSAAGIGNRKILN